ncbi:uncharacterized protein TEOVI_000718400 [Trypanosoma equiperdum]|uniref:Uncharacterized protein n=1 Tax=Trypanosoma equiperdum TaxID=5694 RepID=A0A1G4I3Q5_TRYEQ|nr:hypothetical protein, conserved [Trypanosoma equiperdum]
MRREALGASKFTHDPVFPHSLQSFAHSQMLHTDPQLQQQRVQVVVRGQRFESTVEVLSSSCALFRCFFRGVADRLKGDGERNNDTSAYSFIDCQTCYTRAATEVNALFNSNKGSTVDMMADVAQVEWKEDCCMWRFVYTDKKMVPEDVGVVFVYIRKLFHWNSNGAEEQQRQPPPKFPVRWDEMPYDAQLTMARVVCTFGVEPLQHCHGRPTALPDSSGKTNDVAHTHNQGPNGEHSGQNNGREGEQATPWEKAEAYLRSRAEQERARTEANADAVRGQHPSVDDEDLVLVTVACSRCGVTGHTDHNCRY